MTSALAEPLSLQPIQNHTSAVRPGHVGPGWFDSSWELRRGLEVKEGWSDDDRVRDWIEAWLQIVGGAPAGLSLSGT